MSAGVEPFSLKDAPALIERLLPVQKLSAEAYKEQMANVGKTLTALGSYWKGRKPLILNKACILGCLLPATDDAARDLQIFEMLMGMDDLSFVPRWKRQARPKEILGKVSLARISDYFVGTPADVLPQSSPVDWTDPAFEKVRVAWREDLHPRERGCSKRKPFRKVPTGSASIRPDARRKSSKPSTSTSGRRSTPISARRRSQCRSWSGSWASCASGIGPK